MSRELACHASVTEDNVVSTMTCERDTCGPDTQRPRTMVVVNFSKVQVDNCWDSIVLSRDAVANDNTEEERSIIHEKWVVSPLCMGSLLSSAVVLSDVSVS